MIIPAEEKSRAQLMLVEVHFCHHPVQSEQWLYSSTLDIKCAMPIILSVNQ